MEKSFPRALSSLDVVFQFIDECLRHYHIKDKNNFSMKFIVEELFTNMVKYSKPSNTDISLRIERNNDKCSIVLTEDDVDKFDITKIPDADVTKPIEERTPGGFVVYLIRKMAKRADYDDLNRKSKITIIKHLE